MYTEICATCAICAGGKVDIGQTAMAKVGECQLCHQTKWLYHPSAWNWKNKKTRDRMLGKLN